MVPVVPVDRALERMALEVSSSLVKEVRAAPVARAVPVLVQVVADSEAEADVSAEAVDVASADPDAAGFAEARTAAIPSETLAAIGAASTPEISR